MFTNDSDFNSSMHSCQGSIGNINFDIPLEDMRTTTKGKRVERPWRSKKKKSVDLAFSYGRTAQKFDNKEKSGDFSSPYSADKLIKKSKRVYYCSDTLGFAIDADGEHRLRETVFCRDRLCPLCVWRKSIVDVKEISAVFDEYENRYPVGESGHMLIAVNLGLQNCKPEMLARDVDLILNGFRRLQQYRSLRDKFIGFFRHMEFTLNFGEKITPAMWNKRTSKDGKYNYYKERGLQIGDANPWHNTYNPHLHCIFVVPDNFYDEKVAVSSHLQKKYWADLWQKACRLDYEPMIWTERLRRFGSGKREGKLKLAEFAKYPVKDQSIFSDKLPQVLKDEVVITLAAALRHRKLIYYGGILGSLYKELFGKKDPNDMEVDLINIDDEPDINPTVAETITWYKWDYALSNYFLAVLAHRGED